MSNEWKDGVYYHDKKGFAILETVGPSKWEVNKGKVGKLKFYGVTVQLPLVENHSGGTYFLERSLKGYEYWGEL